MADRQISGEEAIAHELAAQQYLPKGTKSRKAITSITKTPIEFRDIIGDRPEEQGYTYADSPLGLGLQKIFGPAIGETLKKLAPSLYSHIIVNPSPNYSIEGELPVDVIHHEEAHSLLLNLIDSGKLTPRSIPQFNSIAQSLSNQDREGNLTQEVPAYSVERPSSISGASKDPFNQQFLQQLQAVDPQKATLWNQLVNNYSGSGIQ